MPPQVSAEDSRVHLRHARAWAEALWGKAEAVARSAGMRARTIRSWTEPQAEYPTPTERLSQVTRALLELGVPEEKALGPLLETCRDLGYYLVPADLAATGAERPRRLVDHVIEVANRERLVVAEALGMVGPNGGLDDQAVQRVEQAETALRMEWARLIRAMRRRVEETQTA